MFVPRPGLKNSPTSGRKIDTAVGRMKRAWHRSVVPTPPKKVPLNINKMEKQVKEDAIMSTICTFSFASGSARARYFCLLLVGALN